MEFSAHRDTRSLELLKRFFQLRHFLVHEAAVRDTFAPAGDLPADLAPDASAQVANAIGSYSRTGNLQELIFTTGGGSLKVQKGDSLGRLSWNPRFIDGHRSRRC